MNAWPRIAKAAALIGDPSRATMLWSLLGGDPRAAGELAMLANVSPQTASNHLRLLLEAGFVKVAVVGRNKLYRLGGSQVAAALESLALVAPGKQAFRAPQEGVSEIQFARTCYDHLAGALGVALFDRLRARDHLRESNEKFELTSTGKNFLRGVGIDVRLAQAKRRRFAYPCLDWSQRVPHLGGSLGAALLDWLFRTKVIVRRKASRAVRVTDHGHKQLDRIFAIRISNSGTAIAGEHTCSN